MLIALAGQTASHAPHPAHASGSTWATSRRLARSGAPPGTGCDGGSGLPCCRRRPLPPPRRPPQPLPGPPPHRGPVPSPLGIKPSFIPWDSLRWLRLSRPRCGPGAPSFPRRAPQPGRAASPTRQRKPSCDRRPARHSPGDGHGLGILLILVSISNLSCCALFVNSQRRHASADIASANIASADAVPILPTKSRGKAARMVRRDERKGIP